MVSPRPDDVVLGGQFAAPLDAAVLGGIESIKQRFEAGDINAKKAALDRALLYGDKGLDFLAEVSEQELPAEVKGYAKRLRVLELLRKSESRSLAWMDLKGTDLRGVNLEKADLSGSDLSGSDLRGANLRDADLWGANLSKTDIDSSTQLTEKWHLVWDIVNRGANHQNLSGADLSGAELSGAELIGVDLTDAYMNETNLRGANL